MSLSITQTPATCSLAQSPTIFTAYETGDVVLSSSFQYYLDLYYWSGTPNQSGSVANYTLVKYPNASRVGIFDVGRILNSALTGSAEGTPSNVKYFKADVYWRYLSGSNAIPTTGSHVESSNYKALDGYAIFDEPIGQQIQNKTPYWPIMTDGPVSQSCLFEDVGKMSVYIGEYAAGVFPSRIVYSGSLGINGSISISGSAASTISSSQQIQLFPIGPSDPQFPVGLITGAEQSFTVQAFDGTTPISNKINFNVVCKQKYPNIRIKWKNRYGQFDFFSFYMVNRQSFSTTKRGYQPQLGTWTAPTLTYTQYDSSNLNYIVDSKQSISVNTDWIDEDYNEIIKQLLVSEEIYWVKSSTDLLPLTINTESITFKTGVVDKVIQYQFDFDFGQGYKLIL
jgi:hypothetical protein